ncbi:epoxide hydrolase family protein [Bradyrhizobium sp. Leo121]|uniref:epoxide hydrolase family protein n=1 Tax=Bradyrhizobium sp. Leo121 TaxID=1571195 RepID=UPI00102A3860|nr:epoxide hydrolase family protein [Bradyrhizobium sp. Leo121]RZN35003.1 multidrug MFS transporter [Bradyrhizobium sp. Leo121]
MTARIETPVGVAAEQTNPEIVNQDRRKLLTATAMGIAVAGAANLFPAYPAPADTNDAIRPFRINIPEQDLVELRRRIVATRWPDRETVDDQSQGIQLGKLKPLVEYWGKGYDWRKAEAKLNSLPQFMTEIDGLDIYFIHVRSKHPNALPVIITHGWPGSVFEKLKVIGPLTDPTAHGGRAQDAFDVVIPSMPGFGFSGKPTDTGWGPDRIARSWAELMQRLGYTRYVAQGGDWGSPVSSAMARLAPAGLLGIHINLPAVVPSEIAAVIAAGGPAPEGLSEKERAAFDALSAAAKKGNRSYAVIMGARPQTIGYALADSPTGLAAWMLGHPGFTNWTYDNSDPEKSPDEVLDDITLYWLTNSATSAARIYWEYGGERSPVLAAGEKTSEISPPVAITVFPGESYQAPETWARRAYRNLIHFHEVEKGGHFAAWEQPELFSAEIRAAFRPLRQSM